MGDGRPAAHDSRDTALQVVEALNQHDLGMLRRHYAADVRARRPGWPSEGGLDDLLASYEMDFACVPDISYEPLSTVAEGKHVVTEMRITGTNTGPTVLGDFGKALLGADIVPPTNRPIDLPAVFVHEVRDDGFVEAERQYWGLLEFLVQTGVIGT